MHFRTLLLAIAVVGCSDPVSDPTESDGIITNALLLSSLRGTEPDVDTDVSIRPGERIESATVDRGRETDVNISGAGHLELLIDCINPASTPDNACQSAGTATEAGVDVVARYTPNTASREVGHKVLLLIDMSGSLSGIVNDVSFKEDRGPDPLPQNFGDIASDRNDVRLAVAKRLPRTLNARDNFGVIAFGQDLGENGRLVPCAAGDLSCFGPVDVGTWDAGVDGLIDRAGGRSNMWGAIEFAYHFLRDEVAQTDRSNHIIVLTDGPDTCAGEQLLSCQTTCTTADPHALAAKIQADHNDANAPRIRIHFVQFEALGYPGRDARQVEMACVSGGHYQFINSNAFPRGQWASLNLALDTAVANLRFALMGHWELALPSPAYADSGVVPAGALYGLQGTLIVPASSNMVVIDTAFPFGVGQGKEAEEVTNWDRRPTLRKPCSGAADCGASSGACSIGCSAETGLCPGPDDPSELPDLAMCETGGSDGFCCGGTCQSSGGCGDCP